MWHSGLRVLIDGAWRWNLDMALSARPALGTKAVKALETLLFNGTELDTALPLFLPISLYSVRGWQTRTSDLTSLPQLMKFS
jgi:hypothetical protein